MSRDPKELTTVTRHYVFAASRWVIGLMAVTLLPVIVVIGVEDGGPTTWLIMAPIMTFSLYVCVDSWRRGGLTETPTELVQRVGIITTRYKWSEIERFEARRARRVVMLLKSGRELEVPVGQGWKIKWTGGSTRDIVSVLNERLRLHQADARQN